MKTAPHYPFRSTLSFEPLITYIRELDHGSVNGYIKNELSDILKHAPEFAESVTDLTIVGERYDQVDRLMNLIFPSVFQENELIAAVVPFSLEPVFASPAFRRFFLNDDGSMKGIRNLNDPRVYLSRVIRAFMHIVSEYIDTPCDCDYPMIHVVPDPITGLEKHFKIKRNCRLVRLHADVPPGPFSDDDFQKIRSEYLNPEILRQLFPPENFEFRGITLLFGDDITESQVLMALHQDLIDQESIITSKGFQRLQQRLRVYFQRPDLIADIAALQSDQVYLVNTGCEMTECCIFSNSRHISKREFKNTVYEQAIKKNKIIRVNDVQRDFKQQLIERFYIPEMRSMLIAPLEYQGKIIGTLMLAAPDTSAFSPMDELRMKNILPLFAMSIHRAMEEFEHRVQTFIKQKFTAIHPVVEWRFQKASLAYMEHVRNDQIRDIEPIVFKTVYPLYGASDIRGSTHERNEATRKDLSEHLNLALNIIRTAKDARPLLLFSELETRIQKCLAHIQSGLKTGDEWSVIKFLQNDVESLFNHLNQYGSQVNREIETYHSAIHAQVGTVFRLRKHFEDSVSRLNDCLATYLDREEAEVQQAFPHYFERHRTDGVDYLIYVGDSLLEHGGFHELYLKNLRLWQLRIACGLAWHTERLKSELDVLLTTAHLVLVQNTPLSLRFRFDEKQFGVDGAYDIQHAIIKSRIDKAVVNGGERLTQPEKIAIVYAHPEEAQEMERHIDFLQAESWLTDEVEYLELENLPGVQGLRAIRVGIDIKSDALKKNLG